MKSRRSVTTLLSRWALTLIVGVLIAASPGTASAQSDAQLSDDERAALAVVQALFDGIESKDADALTGIFLPEARAVSIATGTPTPPYNSRTVDEFVASVVSRSAPLREVMEDPVVRIDGNMALVWAPYTFFVDGEPSHCGADGVSLVRTSDGWKIAFIHYSVTPADQCNAGAGSGVQTSEVGARR